MMPIPSERKRLISDLEEWVVGRKLMKLNLDLAEADEEEDGADIATVLLQLICATRYLHRPEVLKSTHSVQYVLPLLDDERFKQEVRMSRDAFERTLGRISDRNVFHQHRKTPQADPRLQVMITAYCFGSSGSSASLGKIARRFGVSEGFVDLCTSRHVFWLIRDFLTVSECWTAR
ncbi:hypothetical protein RvY_06946-2 [Ramazzottius varieornatus]|uniref:Uncharacterized protein n=1 Tax=Ramazzottius varieornatus TaxID=947166 RepID=A0A1D1V3M4_RAMVA|nr:hypothetical protein RvY_06946-2 [Ramazzottius varieornatus]